MKLMTNVPIEPTIQMNYNQRILGVGSCFIENIGHKLSEGKFSIALNPFGIVYNPISIAQCLDRVIKNESFTADELFLHQEIWNSWEHHSCFSGTDKAEVLDYINQQIDSFHSYLQSTDYCFLTFGTAYVYRHIASDKMVANCHKVPAKQFEKYRLTVAEIVDSIKDVIQRVRAIRPNIQFVITVSPVRHIKDGIIENQRSKSTLLLASEILDALEHVHYFPSYEIIMDELRDYRFFSKDLVHPNQIAIDYIWDKFQQFALAPNTQTEYAKVLKTVRGFQHRILHPNTTAHRKFLAAQIKMAKEVMKDNPTVDFSTEIQAFEVQLSSML